jgi:hypothetical protein
MPRLKKYTPEEAAERKRLAVKKHYDDNKDKKKELKKQYNEQYRLNNEDKIKQYRTDNKDKTKQYRIQNRDKNKEYFKYYSKQRRQNNILFKLISNLRSLISNSIRNKGYNKCSKSTVILGCTWEEFKQHIESQFEPWMTWDNYGCKIPLGPNITWDLDHIIPINNAITEEDIIRLNHYTNFQPLCSYHNRFVKRDKY